MTLLTTSGDIHAATMATSHFLREKRKAMEVKSEESACREGPAWDGSEERRVKSEESACWEGPVWDGSEEGNANFH